MGGQFSPYGYEPPKPVFTFGKRKIYGFEIGMAAVVAVFVVLFAIAGVAMQRASERDDIVREQWRGAELVKVCIGRTHIYKLRDGTFRTGGWSPSIVSGPDVCQ